jgi:hypothetical protein
MASCDLKTTNREYMISTGALEQGSRRIKNENLFDVKNAEIRDSANQRYNLNTEELPFSKTERVITRDEYLKRGSDYFVEWNFNDKFFDEVTPTVEFYKSMEEEEIEIQTLPVYDQLQIPFEESIDEDVIVKEAPIRSTFPFEAEDYLADVKPETKANLNKLEFKEEQCFL